MPARRCASDTSRRLRRALAYSVGVTRPQVLSRINDLIREQYVLGALSTGTREFYERLGWERWSGPTFVNGPHGLERTPDDDGGILILRAPRSPELDLDGDIVADWRAGDVW